MQERLTQVEGHLLGGSGSPGAQGAKGRKGLLEKKPDDVSAYPLFERCDTSTLKLVVAALDMLSAKDSYLYHLNPILITILLDCHNLRPPHCLHQRRKRRLQRYPSLRPPPWRLQSPHPALWHRPLPRRRHCRRRCTRPRRRRNRIPRGRPRRRLSHDNRHQEPKQTMLLRPPSLRRHRQRHPIRHDRDWNRRRR